MRRESHVRFCEGGGVRFPSATRLVRSIKEECLNRVLLLGERHLRRTIAEFVVHYHAERNHQGIRNELIRPAARTDGLGVVRRRQRMGGMLNFYYRAAA
jgi:putative transposase